MNKVLLEIGTEEIPSHYIDKAIKDLKNSTVHELQQLNLKYSHVSTYGTPRRLIVYIEDIESQQEDISQKIKGPSKAIALDKEGNLQKPAIKFAQSNGISPEKLWIEKTSKGEYLFVKKTIKGEKTKLLMPKMCQKLIANLSFPKSMRWGSRSFRFIRPIRWIVALYNENIISFDLEEIKSHRTSYGHRLLSPKPIKIDTVNDYFSSMEEHFVIISPEQRKNMIREQILKMIDKNDWKVCIDKMLLDEVKNLVEYPRVFLGQFHDSYLELPAEVLKAVMIKHQKYFPVYNKEGSILPHFLVVINGNIETYREPIISGNERVLRARLEDARFFYQEDQRIDGLGLKPLDRFANKLKDVVYQENLGSMYHKVERLVSLTKKIASLLRLSEQEILHIKRAAELCKSDLVSEMVKEFPELQGIMGKEYALLQGEDTLVAQAIFEHYLPRFSEDDLPETISGVVLSIADKLDHITSCFINQITPDGSQDPYALRRQSLGILHIILENHMDFSLENIIDFNIKILLKNKTSWEKIEEQNKKLKQEMMDFIFQRFRYLLLEKGYRYDILDAVLAKKTKSIIDVLFRIKTIQAIYHLPKFNKIITAATRTFNLSKNTNKMMINRALFREKEECLLYDHYLTVKQKIEKAMNQKDYEKVFEHLEALTGPVDSFFDHVLVMEKEENIRNNRLSLLKELTEIYHTIADLSKIALAKGNFK